MTEVIVEKGLRREQRIAYAMASLVVSCSVGIALLIPDPLAAARDTDIVVALLVAVGYAVAEHFVFHIENERDALSISVAEVPTALALIFLSPVVALVLRLIMSFAAIAMFRPVTGYKVVFNVANFGLEILTSYLVFRWLVGVYPTSTTAVFWGVLAALVVAPLVGLFFLAVTTGLVTGDLQASTISNMRTSLVHLPVTSVTGMMVLGLALVEPYFAVIGLLPVAAIWVVVRDHGRLNQYFRDQRDLNAFPAIVGASFELDDIMSSAVREVERLLRAESVTLLTFGMEGQVQALERVGSQFPSVPTTSDDEHWKSILANDGVVSIEFEHARPFVRPHRRVTLAAPIRDEGRLIGLLLIGTRFGAQLNFDPADMARVATVANQLGVMIRKAQLLASMEHAALHDVLTGDLNRNAFERALTEVISIDDPRSSAVLIIDLDRFKEVNDTLGHHVGDRVLIEYSRRISSFARRGDAVARFAGDEFALLVTRERPSDIHELAESLVSSSFEPIHIDELDVVVSFSIGVAFVDTDRTATELIRRADVAMYTAKRARSSIEMYRDDIDRRTPDRLSMLGDLRYALEHDQVEVHYQPTIDILLGSVIGAEALLRWDRPGSGKVATQDLVRVAEESGLIKQVTDYVLRRALRTARDWRVAGYDLGVSVNLSTHDLLDEQLPGRIAALLAQQGVDASVLTLEITESALLVDTPRTMSTVDRLHQMGVELSLDDFGTGYSSLGYLRRLPVDELKVDRSFVSNLLLDEQDEVIVRSTIDLGHNLGLRVVAEGIENAPTMSRLRALGCDVGQGFLISRALSPTQFATWLRSTEYVVPMLDPERDRRH